MGDGTSNSKVLVAGQGRKGRVSVNVRCGAASTVRSVSIASTVSSLNNLEIIRLLAVRQRCEIPC